MSVTLEEIRLAIITWGELLTNRIGVIGNSGEGPKQGSPYFEVFINQYTNNRFQNSEMINEDEEEVFANVDLTVDIDLYGATPMSDASILARSLYAQQRYLDLWQLGNSSVGLLSIDAVHDLTFLENGRMKQRARMSFVLNCLLSQTFDASHIEEVGINIDVPNRNYDEDVVGGTDPRQKAAICGV